MQPLSDREHDAFDNPAKAACREGNLRVLREAAYLLWENSDRTRLRGAARAVAARVEQDQA